MPLTDYLQLLDWTAREAIVGKRGCTPDHIPPILARLSLEPETWCSMVRNFGGLFSMWRGDHRPWTNTEVRREIVASIFAPEPDSS